MRKKANKGDKGESQMRNNANKGEKREGQMRNNTKLKCVLTHLNLV